MFASSAVGRIQDEPQNPPQNASGNSHEAAAVSAPQPVVNTPEHLFQTVSAMAQDLSTKPYHHEVTPLPKPFRGLGYDGYRRLRPRAEASIWRDEPGEFAVLPLPRGYIFDDSIEVNLVENGVIRPLTDGSAYVDFGDFGSATPAERSTLGISGWRALFPYRNDGKVDEAAVFQGGAYFRSLAQRLVYGASARALAIGTASRKGEEFPRLSKFWIFKPAADSATLTVAALLDTDSATGAYLFTIQPGKQTVMGIRAVIYPRKEITEMGVGAISSMFMHSLADRGGVDDYRPEVHDSDGLAMLMGNGEMIWRPLTNPRDLQVSLFHDRHPRGFGLMQRERSPSAYDDLEARYERRPSVWVEPIGDWGAGHVMLVEIPTPNEYNDNIVAFWRPDEAWEPGTPQKLSYRLVWSGAHGPETPVARVVASRSGATPNSPLTRRFVIDFANAPGLGAATADVWASVGEVRDVHIETTDQGGRRVSFDLDPKGAPLVELRAALVDGGVQQSETWLFRWTPD
ncbi:MAG: glucan biosynthesis protein G [Alphaproteobacteria bacterium]